MINANQGLTATYNAFHNPCEKNEDIVELRRQHERMDRATLDSYNWTDIPTQCEFTLDYEIESEHWGRKLKPYRYRWPTDVHDEVFSRLLRLNHRRRIEELEQREM